MKGFSDNEDGLCPVHLKLAANLTEYPQTYGCPQCAVNHIEELKEELADRDRTILSLRAAIESAPHENACRFRVCVCGEGYSTSTRHGCASPQRKDCNCWKSILPKSEVWDAVQAVIWAFQLPETKSEYDALYAACPELKMQIDRLASVLGTPKETEKAKKRLEREDADA
jgi:hypothetical protein